MCVRLIKALEDYLSNADHSGHASYCAACCGPYNEEYIRPEHCNCELSELMAALEEVKNAKSTL